MPGFDGSGPAGAGPFTGGGRGYCAANLDNIPPRTTGGLNRGSLPGTAAVAEQPPAPIFAGRRYVPVRAGFGGRRGFSNRRGRGAGRGRGGGPTFRGRAAGFYR